MSVPDDQTSPPAPSESPQNDSHLPPVEPSTNSAWGLPPAPPISGAAKPLFPPPTAPPDPPSLSAVDPDPPQPSQPTDTDPIPESPNADQRVSPITRRRFVQGLLVTGVAGAAGAGVILSSGRGSNDEAAGGQDPQEPTAEPRQQNSLAGTGANVAPADQRILVVIELEGGNDGLSTFVPKNIGSYYDLRPNLAIPEEDLLAFDDELGLNPNLVQLSQRPLTLIEGVGPVNGNLSHFDMVRRWEQGDASGAGANRTGFLARLVDAVADGSAMTGLSVAGHTPRFTAAKGSVLSIDNPNQLKTLTDDEWIFPSYRNGLRTFAGGPFATEVADSLSQLLAIGDNLDLELVEPDGEDPMIKEGGALGRQLQNVSNLIVADVGVKVVHVQLTGFDTHQGHDYRHEELMRQFDVAVGGFLNQIETAGLSDRVLVATTSEFGRRVAENGNGLDHGSASTMLLSGPITPGRLGEPSPLDDLDEDGNAKTTVSFNRYLATLAQSWLGVEAAAILPNDPEPFELF